MKYFVSAINTESGKTVVSAILAELLSADYWKPIQAGDLDNTDSMKVRDWCSERVTVHPEGHRLQLPMSPHAAAEREGIKIIPAELSLPATDRPLVVEGAGGLLAPISDDAMMAELATQWQLPIILVVNFYLGSINHTLLSLQYLKSLDCPVAGLVFNGEQNEESRAVIEKHSPFSTLFSVPPAATMGPLFVRQQARQLESLGARPNLV